MLCTLLGDSSLGTVVTSMAAVGLRRDDVIERKPLVHDASRFLLIVFVCSVALSLISIGGSGFGSWATAGA